MFRHSVRSFSIPTPWISEDRQTHTEGERPMAYRTGSSTGHKTWPKGALAQPGHALAMLMAKPSLWIWLKPLISIFAKPR